MAKPKEKEKLYRVLRYDYYGAEPKQAGHNITKERADAYAADMRGAHPGAKFVVEPEPSK